MKRHRGLLSIFLFFGLAILIGCGDTITLNPSAQWAEGIQVSGTGSAFGPPDLAILNLGVSAEERTVEAAREVAARAMQGIIDSVKGNGVAEDDIHTQQFSIQPRYDYSNGEQILRGYMVTNTVSVRIRNMDSVGGVIDDAAIAGGDETRINSIQFTIDDPTALQAEARVDAMADAQAKAATLADEGGVTLGDPISISESSGSTPPTYYDDRNKYAAEPAYETPIETGTLEVRVTVSVIYAID